MRGKYQKKNMSIKGQRRHENVAQILRKHGMKNSKVEQGLAKVISSFMP